MALTRAQDSKDVDYARSTGAYPTPEQPTTARPADTDDINYAASTGAYPMPADAGPVVVDRAVDDDGDPIDFTASTGAFPMPGQAPTIKAAHVGAAAVTRVQTPGPVSTGRPEVVARQRTDLGLSDDPSGEADRGAPARPSTVPGPGFDGADRERPADADDQGGEDDDEPQAKVVMPPATPQARPARRTQADGKSR